jgi:hypothetical protein
MKRLHVFSIAALVAVSACSSHGAPALPQVAPKPATTGTGGATLSIVVPRASEVTAASSSRRPQYVSPSSAQLQVAVNGGTPATYGLTPSSPGCNTATAGLTCTFTVAAAPGNDTFALTLTDGAGVVLSRNIINATLTAGASTPIDVTLAGVPVSVRAVPGHNAAIEGSGTPAYHIPGLLSQPIELQALDADGNVIIGPGAPTIGAPTVSSGSAYATIASANSADPNAYILSTVNGSAGGQTVTITATAQSIPLNDGSTSTPASGSTSFTYTPALASGAGVFVTLYSLETGNPVAQFNVCPGSCGLTIINGLTTDAGGNIYVKYQQISGISTAQTVKEFPAGSTFPSRVLGSAAGVTGSGGIAVDANGMLYVANAAAGFFLHRTPAAITEYATGATTPTYKITGSSLTGPQGIAADASGKVYLSQDDGTINIYGPGNQTIPQNTLTDPSVGSPTAILVDTTGGIYALDHQNLDIAYFAAGSTSVTSTLTYSDFQNTPSSMMFDPSGNLWVSIPSVNSIHQFAAGSLPSSLSLLQTFNTAAPYIGWIP